ncbi:MAG: hypothetical protein RMM28_11200 [Thermoleophilia bacterium]|nr:hypothetical protein [Gaiellaceae bacterium]MDW8339693.1 hypothetical protein [Thermoleophilia bacterium]
MSRREVARRVTLALAGTACLAAAAAVAALAVDVVRSKQALADADAAFRETPEVEWEGATILPASVSRGLLGLGDDLELREALRALRRARLDDYAISDPELVLLRNEAQERLEAIAAGGGDPAWRSRAAGLLGVLGLVRLATETQERDALLEQTVSSLQRALALDPRNDEAKLNLEIALQRGRSIQLVESGGGRNPSPSGRGSKGAGAGDPGRGY